MGSKLLNRTISSIVNLCDAKNPENKNTPHSNMQAELPSAFPPNNTGGANPLTMLGHPHVFIVPIEACFTFLKQNTTNIKHSFQVSQAPRSVLTVVYETVFLSPLNVFFIL